MSEFDSAAALSKSPPKSLAAFLASGAEPARLWRPEELNAIFRHQLAAPILVDLGGFDQSTAVRLKNLSDAQNLLLKSFADLFRHPVPPLELLKLTKDFAKANMDHPDGCLPHEVASALYYASIAAALVRLDTRISRLPDADLARGLDWALHQPWLDANTGELFKLALQKISPQ
jgi:hypothetical protein